MSLDSTCKARTIKPSPFLTAFNLTFVSQALSTQNLTQNVLFNKMCYLTQMSIKASLILSKATLRKCLYWIWTLLELCWISCFIPVPCFFSRFGLLFAHDLGQKPLTEWRFLLLNFSLEELWPLLKMLRYSTAVQNVLFHFHSLTHFCFSTSK